MQQELVKQEEDDQPKKKQQELKLGLQTQVKMEELD